VHHRGVAAGALCLSLPFETFPPFATQFAKKFLSSAASPVLLPIGFGGYAVRAICRHFFASSALSAEACVVVNATMVEPSRTAAQNPFTIRCIVPSLKFYLILRSCGNNGEIQQPSKDHFASGRALAAP
jgi:hypothetical protein